MSNKNIVERKFIGKNYKTGRKNKKLLSTSFDMKVRWLSAKNERKIYEEKTHRFVTEKIHIWLSVIKFLLIFRFFH